jgi:acyl-CoA thioester hydrolase
VVVTASMEFLKQLHYPGDVIARMSAAKPAAAASTPASS